MPFQRRDLFRWFGTTAVAAQLGWETATLVRAHRTARVALNDAPGPPPDVEGPAPILHLLVPALNEQPFVQRTVTAFAAVRDAYPCAYVWFVTTARERPSVNGRDTTKDAVERTLAGMDRERMAVLHDPRTAGNKASQLNWAVDQIDQRTGLTDPAVWVGVFDFDSRPHPDTAAWVAAHAHVHWDEAIQVVPLGTAMLAGPPAQAWPRSVILTEALHHATRSLGVERWKLDRRGSGRTRAQYLVGAGMFVRQDALRSVRGFPFVDDVPLGYRLFLEGARFATVPVLNRVDLPDTFAAHVGSLKFIARGVLNWPSLLAETRSNRSVSVGRRLRLAGLGIADTAEVTVYPWLAAVLTPTLVRSRWTGRLLVVAWWGLPLIQTVVMRHVLSDELDRHAWRAPAAALAAASLGRRFWRTFGAWRLGGDALRSLLTGNGVTFAKPSRATRPTTETSAVPP